MRHKVNGAIIITFLLIAVVFMAIQIPFQKHRMQNAIQSIELLLHTLVDRDREQLANEIFDSRLKALKLRLQQMHKVNGVLAIAVFNNSGELLIADGAPFTSTNLTRAAIASAQSNVSLKKEQWQHQAGLLYTQEISFLGESLGFIQIAYSLSDVDQDQKTSFRVLVSLLLVMLLLMLTVLNAILSRAVLAPISYLKEATQRIAEGDRSQPIDISRKDEIGTLAQSFEEMRTEINSNISELERRFLERKQAEKESRYLRNYLSNIIDSMPSVLVVVDRDIRVTMWNLAAEQVMAVSAEAALGMPLTKVFPQMSLKMEQLVESIQEKKTKHSKKVARSLEKETRYEDITIYPLTARGVEGAVIRIDDVTEFSRMEEMMVQSQKMLSVGGLAAGMAHEINNPLAVMLQTANVIGNRLGGKLDNPASRRAAEEAGTTLEAIRDFMVGRDIPRMLTTIEDSGQRVADIVANMLNFARKDQSQSSSHDLAVLLEESLELATIDYNIKKRFDFKKIQIKREYQNQLPPVICESNMIKQVLLNVLRNCGQAMHEAGLDSPLITVRTRFSGDREMAVVEIEDYGPGMTEEIRQRIFEPFFTTKPVGEGTGLGLSVSYFIITENHGGEISVVSAPGEGARFIIRLPSQVAAS